MTTPSPTPETPGIERVLGRRRIAVQRQRAAVGQLQLGPVHVMRWRGRARERLTLTAALLAVPRCDRGADQFFAGWHQAHRLIHRGPSGIDRRPAQQSVGTSGGEDALVGSGETAPAVGLAEAEALVGPDDASIPRRAQPTSSSAESTKPQRRISSLLTQFGTTALVSVQDLLKIRSRTMTAMAPLGALRKPGPPPRHRCRWAGSSAACTASMSCGSAWPKAPSSTTTPAAPALYAEQALRRLSDRLRERRGSTTG